MSHHSRNTAGLLLLLVLVAASGCSNMKMPTIPVVSYSLPEYLGGKVDKSDLAGRYGPTPASRLESLEDIAKQSRGLNAGDQHRVSEDLAQQIQQEQDPVVRRQIIRTLAHMKSPAADHILRAGLHGDKDTSVRVACCESLGQRGGPEAIRELLTVVEHEKNIDVRLAAMRSLGDIGDPSVVPALAVALEPRQDPALQYRTAQVLTKLTGQNYGNDLVAWRSYVSTGTVPVRRPEPSIADRTLDTLQFWR